MRTLKPDAFTSLTLSDVDRGIRWTFSGLWTYCDDQGRAVWDARLIKAAVYPLDDDVTPAVIESDMKELERVGAVCIYSIDGRRYLHVPAWSEHQHPNRPVPSKLPECPADIHGGPGAALSTDAKNASGTLLQPFPDPPCHSQLTEDAVSTHGEGSGNAYPPETPATLPPQSALTEDAVSPHGGLTPVVVVVDVDVDGESGKPEPQTTPLRLVSAQSRRPDVESICDHLATLIEGNGSKRPTVTERWRTECRLMLDKDGRSESETRELLEWCQQDGFWHGNILSMPKFRQQYDQLRLHRERGSQNGKPTANNDSTNYSYPWGN